ncbi:MAG: hypothetical protein U5L10_02145 [Candidatus Moranbacteria bacterium]|nr:hypothetical protein [Candidatus Moranbacteria bacterium]
MAVQCGFYWKNDAELVRGSQGPECRHIEAKREIRPAGVWKAVWKIESGNGESRPEKGSRRRQEAGFCRELGERPPLRREGTEGSGYIKDVSRNVAQPKFLRRCGKTQISTPAGLEIWLFFR